MPDSTRPTRSMFFKLIKSVLSTDSSLSRITSDPGGKNANIIFAYITSLAYDKVMHTKNENGIDGISILKNHRKSWITPVQFLEKLNWGKDNGQVTEYAKFAITQLFKSFTEDGVFKTKDKGENRKYQFLEELDYPSDDQIETAKQSNKYFMLAMNDLLDELVPSLKSGVQTTSRSRSQTLPMWEAILNDPLTDVFRNEMILKLGENLPDITPNGQVSILEISVGTGAATERLLRHVLDKYENVTINYHAFDEISNQLKRAREQIMQIDKELKKEYKQKGIDINYQFSQKPNSELIDLPNDSIDIVVAFQPLNYIQFQGRKDFFKNLARMMNKKAVSVIAQTTSYNEDFPHPLTLAYLPVKGFNGYPTVDELKEITKTNFDQVKSSGIDSIWVLKQPK